MALKGDIHPSYRHRNAADAVFGANQLTSARFDELAVADLFLRCIRRAGAGGRCHAAWRPACLLIRIAPHLIAIRRIIAALASWLRAGRAGSANTTWRRRGPKRSTFIPRDPALFIRDVGEVALDRLYTSSVVLAGIWIALETAEPRGGQHKRPCARIRTPVGKGRLRHLAAGSLPNGPTGSACWAEQRKPLAFDRRRLALFKAEPRFDSRGLRAMVRSAILYAIGKRSKTFSGRSGLERPVVGLRIGWPELIGRLLVCRPFVHVCLLLRASFWRSGLPFRARLAVALRQLMGVERPRRRGHCGKAKDIHSACAWVSLLLTLPKHDRTPSTTGDVYPSGRTPSVWAFASGQKQCVCMAQAPCRWHRRRELWQGTAG